MKKTETYEAYDYSKLSVLTETRKREQPRKSATYTNKKKSNTGKVVTTVAVGATYAGARTIWKLMKRYM